jgi:asparagine synthase (glutamine-hydrolysing)
LEEKHIHVNLNNKYTQWSKTIKSDYTLYVRGYAFINEQYYIGDTFVRYISDYLDNTDFKAHISVLKKFVPQFNGGWALIYETNNIVFAAVDRFRSIPLFYAIDSDRFFLSDNAIIILKYMNNRQLDDICAAEFLVAGCVTGRDTLYKGLFKVLPGEFLEARIIENGSIQLSTYTYYQFIFGNYYELSEYELEEELSNQLDRVFSRYAIALKGKTPVVSLSGGLDSRLIVAMLKKHDVKNVVCFSYGMKGYIEADISREVANALGYEWLFFPHNYPLWYKWFREEDTQDYMEYASNQSSYSATHYLPSTKMALNHIARDDIVFITGYSGDFLAGSFIPDELYAAENTIHDALVPEAILSLSYKQLQWRNSCSYLEDLFLMRIRKRLPDFLDTDRDESIGAYGTWQFENNQATYIINLVRVYEFFGSQWMLPLWDYELMDFFLRVKVSLRYQKKLYRNTLLNKIFIGNLANLATIHTSGLVPFKGFVNQEIKHHSLSDSIHKKIKAFTPDFARNLRDYQRQYKRYKSDFLAHYGEWKYTEKEEGSFFKLLNTKLADVLIHTEGLPDSVKCILKPYMNKSILAIPDNSTELAYCLAFITSIGSSYSNTDL